MAMSGENGNRSDPLIIRVVMGALRVVSWLREQWLLWLMIMSMALAHVSPVVLPFSWTPTAAVVCSGVTFFLTGFSLPLSELGQVRKLMQPTSVVWFHTFLMAPALGLGVYYFVLPSLLPPDHNQSILTAGFLCMCCLPTPMLVSMLATSASGGNEAVSQALSVWANAAGLLLVSPLGIQGMLRMTGTLDAINSKPAGGGGSSDSLNQVLVGFFMTSLLPLALGIMTQHVMTHSGQWRTQLTADDPWKRQLTTASQVCGEAGCVGEGLTGPAAWTAWKGRTRQCSVLTLVFLNYIIFSGLFHPAEVSPSSEGAGSNSKGVVEELSWMAIGVVTSMIAAVMVTQAAIAWLVTGVTLSNATPEDRIAVFFLCFQKSELLAIPLLIQTCDCSSSSPRVAGLLVLPSVISHCVQSILAGTLTHPLKEWRNRQHCRPGTTLLPLRFTKAAKHAPLPGFLAPSSNSAPPPGSGAAQSTVVTHSLTPRSSAV